MRLNTLALGLSLVATAAAHAQGKVAPGSYQIDAAHSKVSFEIPHLVISTVDGRFTAFEGSVSPAEPFSASNVNVTIDAATIDTGNGKRDDHLRSPDFFDVKTHPKLTFKSTKVEGTADAFKITGDLTMHGVTRSVTLDGKALGTIVDQGGNQRAAFKASGKVNRQDFGLKWSKAVEVGPVVGDEVTINLNVEATKAATTAKK